MNIFKQKGFTIVEIIIVITVIGILAAIAVVSYNGIVQRANNTQTVEAVRQWAEALQAYEADHNGDPSALAATLNNNTPCLGEGYPYGHDGQGVDGGQCIGISEEIYLQEFAPFNNMMKQYFDSGIPTPSFQSAQGTYGGDDIWMRGAFMTLDPVGIAFVVSGVSQCPQVGNASSHEYGSEQSLAEQMFSDIELDNAMLCYVSVGIFE